MYTLRNDKGLSLVSAGLMALFFSSALAAGDPTYPPSGAAPTVDAQEEEQIESPRFSPGVEEEALPQPTNMPPLHTIPPVPMPQPGPQLQSDDSGTGVMYDPATKQEVPSSGANAGSASSVQGGYYAGADGGPGPGEIYPASFGTKTLIADATRANAPWRMNVKVAFRRGANWFVCSGALRDARTVQLAGHCVHEGNGGDWNDETWVFPGWDGDGSIFSSQYDRNHYGAARGAILGAGNGWINNGNLDFDWGVVELDRSVGFLTGWYGWQYGTGCPTATYNVGPYPAEGCGSPGLHNGRDMYYWWGTIDSCPGNQLRINTTAGCFTALWGGESGSNLYQKSGDSRFVRGIASTSNRTTVGQYVNILQSWVDWINNTFLPNWGRGATFDLEALDMNVSPTTLKAGGAAPTLLNHLGANGTNGAKDANFPYQVRLSTNNLISTGDTNISNQSYNWNFGGLGSVRVNMFKPSIPENTPPGTYWLGVTYSGSADTRSGNNDSSYWDAVQITVTQETNPPSPSTMTWLNVPSALNDLQINMRATTATDPSGGIQYYFQFTSSPTGGTGGTHSGWQASSSYVDSVQSGHRYCYRVFARDTYSNQTSPSSIKCATTLDNTDTDRDLVWDINDNCTLVGNPSQCDGDKDGFGNHCDADLNNDGITNGLDIGPMKAAFGTTDAAADLNCDGVVNGLDIGPMKAMFGTVPGPAGALP